jgi:predicted RecA/RadA family phage recombinase
MAKNYIQPGNVIDVTAAGALTSGIAFAIGTLLAVPLSNATAGQVVAAQIEGVFELPKASAAVYTAGEKLTWDVSAGEFSEALAAAGDLVACAVAIAPAAGGTTTVLAKLLPGVGTVQA